MRILNLVVLSCVLMLFSCKSNDGIGYFQDLREYQEKQLTAKDVNYEVKICKGDQLAIFVSNIDPNAVAVFNQPLTTFMQPGQEEVSTTPVIQTYLVDSNGDIQFPVVGTIHAAGLTRKQLAAILRDKIAVYAKDPLVTVLLQNFTVSVLGEVNKPGTILITNERVSILDAIGLAGDLTIYGDRSNVCLVRDTDGQKTYVRFDLTSSDIFSSPYFYLQQNDVVYVEPNKARKGNAKYNVNAQYNLSIVSTVVSAVSVLASLAIALWR